MYNINENYARALHYIEKLRKGIVRVNFTKVDGSGREMYCTRNHDYISKYVDGDYEGNSEEMIEKDLKSGKITVFDCEKKDFRSFKVDKVNSFVTYSSNIEMEVPDELMKDVYKVFYKKQEEILNNFVVKLSFRKADGTMRVLYGTRNKKFIKSLIGKRVTFDDSEFLSKEQYVMSVFDLENLELRRYKLSRLNDFKLLDTEQVRNNFISKFNAVYYVESTGLVKGLDGSMVHYNNFNYFVNGEKLIKRYINNREPVTILDMVSRDVSLELEKVFFNNGVDQKRLNMYIDSEVNNKEFNKGTVDKGEVELSIKLDGNLEGAEIKSFCVEGNEVKLVLNIK